MVYVLNAVSQKQGVLSRVRISGRKAQHAEQIILLKSLFQHILKVPSIGRGKTHRITPQSLNSA